MTDTDDDVRAARHAAIRAEVAQEEADAAEVDAADNAIALDVPLHLRIDRQLDEPLMTSRRLLRQAIGHRAEPLTTADVEQIARRIAREEINHT